MSDLELILELRSSALRFLARDGKTEYLNGPHGPKTRIARIGNIWFKITDSRHLEVGVSRPPIIPDVLVYDSEQGFDYQNVHVMRHVVMPALRQEMILDDLAAI